MEILTSIVGAIGAEIVKYTLVPLGRQIGYLIFYNGNITKLGDVLDKLNNQKASVDLLVEAAKGNLDISSPSMITWQRNANDIIALATNFLLEEDTLRNRKCLKNLCPNPKSRYSLSRKATKIKHEIIVLLCEAEKYNITNLPAPLPALGSIFNTEDTKEFESRNLIMNKILLALRDDSLSMMSICGQGGVGKTIMVEKLVQIVESQKLFDRVAMAVVSQNPEKKKIQGDIASGLGLSFDNENEQLRAQMLHERIIVKGEKKILLILDDVWTEADFRGLQIPSAGKRVGYKILLTSRREDECRKMGSLMNFRVDPLSPEEGWNLFKGIAFSENSIYNKDKFKFAKEIADECDGLPIAIVTIAKALKGRDKRIWGDALNQLRSSNLKGLSGMEKVFSRLELSYKLLQCEEAKACFLLCCLFPEDSAIQIEDLVRYAIGLRLLENAETIIQARDRVYALVCELKESFLLLGSNKDEDKYVKMHDVVRDVAISIAARDKSYLISCDNMTSHWPNKWLDRYNHCTAISLVCKEINKRPTNMECPKLQLLQLRSSGLLQDNFFEGMEELKVVNLIGCFLPKSLDVLKKVRTLYLPQLGNTSMVGDLKSVEILKIGRLKDLPSGVGLMENLRMLDLREAASLKYIPPGLLSKLSKLEELYVSLEFRNWELGVDTERTNASLKEIDSQHITTLEIGVPVMSRLPKRSILELLVKFKILGGWSFENTSKLSGNALVLTGDADEIVKSGICVVLKRVEHLNLEKVRNMKNGIYELGDDGFPELMKLEMCKCNEMEQLVEVTKITDGCFRVLRELTIRFCLRLKYLFPMVMATRMSQSLERIYIERCENMEGIFNGKEEDDEVEFQNLKDICLVNLYDLKAFSICKSNDQQEVKSNSMEQFPILFSSFGIVTPNLKVLRLINCASLKAVFSAPVVGQLLHLQTLEIEDCNNIEYIVGGRELNMNKTLVFPKLTKLKFTRLPKLVSFCVHSYVFLDWSSLEDISVEHCRKIEIIFEATQSSSALDEQQILFKIPSEYKKPLKVKELRVRHCENVVHVFSSDVAKLLVKLEKCIIEGSNKMEQVIAKGTVEEKEANGTTQTIQFFQLKSITLELLPSIRCFYGGIYAMEFPLLESLQLKSCSSMKAFSYGSSLSTPNLESILVGGIKIFPIIDLNTTIRQEILEKLQLCYVHHLPRISLHHLSNEEMREIRQIKLVYCTHLLNVVPFNLIRGLQNVEILDVDKCGSVEEIFEYDGVSTEKGNVPIFSHLQQLFLENLNSLKTVFNKIPTSVIVFHKLKLLRIHICNRLKSIFSVSMARGLFELEQLTISCCKNLEEIISKENEEEKAVTGKIILPQLLSVDVSDASKLTCFYNGTIALELPSLRNLKLKGHIMETFSNGLVSTPRLTQVQTNEKDFQCSGDLNEDLKNENLGKVDIESPTDFTMKICLATGDTSRVKYLSISNCNILSNAIPREVIRRVQKLEKLQVKSCDSVEEIFEYEGVHIDETSVALISNLEEMNLESLPNLRHISNNVPRSIVSFHKLKKLDVYRCNKLEHIFSISSVRDLVQLEELKVTDCDGVEHIVEEQKDEEITTKIVFLQLQCIDISYCSAGSFKLKCFYNGINALEFPTLERLSLNRCYNMTAFSTRSSLSTPVLQQVRINDNNYPCTGDLNQDIKNKRLEVVHMEEGEHLTRVCRTAKEGSSGIRDLRITSSNSSHRLTTVIPFSLIQNLENLRVGWCHSMGWIFYLDEQTSFSSLKSITLDHLDFLRHIFIRFNKSQILFVGFQQLSSLEVGNCEKLEHVFPVCVARSLPQLQLLQIYDCWSMRKIIVEEEDEEEQITQNIVLPKLKSLSLSSLSNLKCFYDGIRDIEFPLLQSLSVKGCHNMTIFSNGSVSAPKLQDLQRFQGLSIQWKP